MNHDPDQIKLAHTFIFSVLQNMRKIRTLTLKNFVFLNAPKGHVNRGYNTIRVLNLQDCNTMMLIVSLGSFIQNVEEINIDNHFQDLNWNLASFKRLKKLKLSGDMADLSEIFGGLNKAHNPVYMTVTLNFREGATQFDWLLKNMSHLKFKHIHIMVKTLRVSTDIDIKHHEFQMEDTKEIVNHTLYKKEEGEENMTLSYKKTMGEDIQKIVI